MTLPMWRVSFNPTLFQVLPPSIVGSTVWATAGWSTGLAAAERSFELVTTERSACCAFKDSVVRNSKTRAQIEERAGRRETVTHTSGENGAKPRMLSLQAV